MPCFWTSVVLPSAKVKSKNQPAQGTLLLGTGLPPKKGDIYTHSIKWSVCNEPLKAMVETFCPHVAYSGRNKRKVRKTHTHTPSGPLHLLTPSKDRQAINVNGVDFKRKGLTLGKTPGFSHV